MVKYINLKKQNNQSFNCSLSKKNLTTSSKNVFPMPEVFQNSVKIKNFEKTNRNKLYPNVRRFKRKFGLLIPATNTTMEYDIWSIIFKNNKIRQLKGIRIHTSNISTPNPQLETQKDLVSYKTQFLGGLRSAVNIALLAEPEYLIMGMSLEHIINGLEKIRLTMAEIENYSGLAWSTWHDAIRAALNKYQANNIGLITPFNNEGNKSVTQMFEDLGFEVVSIVSFSCKNALQIAHIPDWAKENATMELLSKSDGDLDAIVQCGTNMSYIHTIEKLEPLIKIPIMGINPVIFWHALRENGFNMSLDGGGILLQEF